MQKTTGFFRKQLSKSETIEYQIPESNKAFEKFKDIYDSKGRNNSTLSNDGDDSDFIKS